MRKSTGILRTTVLMLLIGVTISGYGSNASAAEKKVSVSTCSFRNYDTPSRWTEQEVKKTIRCAVSKWSVSGGISKALAIAYRESRFHWHSTNTSSGACGVYQHLAAPGYSPSYWAGRQDAWDNHPWDLGESCYNARSNIIVTIRMVHAGGASGWGPWGG